MKTPAALVLFCVPFLGTAQFYWEQRADIPVQGLWGPASFVIDGKGYIVAGRTNGTDVANVWMYDADADSWTARAPIPIARRYAAGFAINGKGYVACGVLGNGGQLDDLWEYDPVVDTWSSRAAFPGDPRYGSHYFALGGLGYVGSGNAGISTGPFMSDMYAYNPTTNSWSAKASLPGLSRYGTSTIAASGKAFVFGGLMSNMQHTGDIYEYDPGTDVWTLRPPIPGATRTYALALSYPWDGVVAAGKSGAGVNIYDGFRYIPGTNSWTAIPSYPGESGWVGATMAINGRSFGGLGYTLTDNEDHNDWWELVKGSAEGIVEIGSAGAGALLVSPNPVHPGESMTFDRTELGIGGSVLRTSIFNVAGEQIFSAVLRIGDVLPCPLIADGAYMMRLQVEDGTTWTGRFVVLGGR